MVAHIYKNKSIYVKQIKKKFFYFNRKTVMFSTDNFFSIATIRYKYPFTVLRF